MNVLSFFVCFMQEAVVLYRVLGTMGSKIEVGPGGFEVFECSIQVKTKEPTVSS